MKETQLKGIVLKEIREALMEKNDPVHSAVCINEGATFINADSGDLPVVYAKSFIQAGGMLHYCLDEAAISKALRDIQHQNGDCAIGCASENLTTFMGHLGIPDCSTCTLDASHQLGASLCEALLAWQGSIVITSNLGLGKTILSLPKTTIIIAFTSQVVTDWEMANKRLKQLYGDYPATVLIANPNSYACRRGLQKLHLILIEDEQTDQ